MSRNLCTGLYGLARPEGFHVKHKEEASSPSVGLPCSAAFICGRSSLETESGHGDDDDDDDDDDGGNSSSSSSSSSRVT